MKEEDDILTWLNAWFPLKRDKSFMILFIIYLSVLLADLITTLRLGILVKYLEANPLLKIGGLPLIVIVNIIVAILYFYCYKKGSTTTRFITMFCLVAVIMTRLIVIRQNILVAANPPTLEQAMAVTQAIKTETIKKLVVVNVFPFFNGIFAYFFFRYDHNIEKK